jgi:methionyl aminopeptidase
MKLKTSSEIEAMAIAGRAAANTLQKMKTLAIPGISTMDLEEAARAELKLHNAKPALLGYHPRFSRVPYEFATCISVNDEVIHGQPSSTRILREGDVVGLDLVADVDGWLADTAITIIVGKGSQKAQRLLSVTQEALRHGIAKASVGARMGDVSNAVQRLVERNGFGVIRELSGHGVGSEVHEEGIEVPNFGLPGKGLTLQVGMTFCIEPMVTAGAPGIKHRPGDPWAVVTRDGSIGAHFEHTVAITEAGARILTAIS